MKSEIIFPELSPTLIIKKIAPFRMNRFSNRFYIYILYVDQTFLIP